MTKHIFTAAVLILKLCVSSALPLWSHGTYRTASVDTRPGFALRSRPTPKTPEQIAAAKVKAEQKRIDHAAHVQRNLRMIAARNLRMIAARKQAAYLSFRRSSNRYKSGNCMRNDARGW